MPPCTPFLIPLCPLFLLCSSFQSAPLFSFFFGLTAGSVQTVVNMPPDQLLQPEKTSTGVSLSGGKGLNQSPSWPGHPRPVPSSVYASICRAAPYLPQLLIPVPFLGRLRVLVTCIAWVAHLLSPGRLGNSIGLPAYLFVRRWSTRGYWAGLHLLAYCFLRCPRCFDSNHCLVQSRAWDQAWCK